MYFLVVICALVTLVVVALLAVYLVRGRVTPRYGLVALFGPNVSDRLSSSEEAVPASTMILVVVSSHPTVGVALFGPNVSDRLSSSSEGLRYRSVLYFSWHTRFRTSP